MGRAIIFECDTEAEAKAYIKGFEHRGDKVLKEFTEKDLVIYDDRKYEHIGKFTVNID